MNLDELLQDIHALEEELIEFERRYGVRSETFYAAYQSGEEPEDERWVLDFGEWASVYRTWLARQSEYREAKLASVTPTGSSEPVAQSLPVAVKKIVSALSPEQIVLFGSYAHGRPTSDSDVDLLVVMETNETASERFLAVSRLLRPRPFPVDILVKTPQEIKRALDRGDDFITEIVTQGKVLYERSN